MLKKVVLFLVLAAVFVATAPSFACNQRCNHATGDCENVGWTTHQACETWGGFCYDVPVSGCRGGAPEPDFLSAETTKKPVEAPTCTPTKEGGDAN